MNESKFKLEVPVPFFSCSIHPVFSYPHGRLDATPHPLISVLVDPLPTHSSALSPDVDMQLSAQTDGWLDS